MGLKLKDVYNQRNGIIAFCNNLYDDIRSSQFTSMDRDFNETAGLMHIHPNLPENIKKLRDDPSKKEEYDIAVKRYAPQFAQDKKYYLRAYRNMVAGGRQEAAYHMVALNAYFVVYDKYKSILDWNPGKENDPVVMEYKKNVDIFKALLRKNGIFDFEIKAAEEKDPDLNEKICDGILKSIDDRNTELMNHNHVQMSTKNPAQFKDCMKRLITTDCIEKAHSDSINATNNEFFGMIKNAGYGFSRSYNCEYYDCPDRLDKACPGYEFNEDGEMIAKKSTGFFSSIANFFHRLAHHNEVDAYNTGLRQVKEVDTTEALEEAEKMNRQDEAVRQEKERVLVDEDFLKEHEEDTKVQLDFEAERQAEQNLEKEAEKAKDKEMAENFIKSEGEEQAVNPAVGPGLDQLD